MITVPEGQTNCQSCGKPWKVHSFKQMRECGICGMCHRVMKEHSVDEYKTCDEADQAQFAATPCEICGKLEKEHSQEQSMECLEKRREHRQGDKKGIEFLRKLSKELPGDDENIVGGGEKVVHFGG